MSQRVLIVGVSESGKSSLARRLIAPAQAAGLPVYVRDPLGYNWEEATGYFSDSETLRALMMKHGTPAVVVIDECADFFRAHQVQNHWIFTQGRHHGLLPIAIGQRIKMMAPNVREMASDLYVLESAKASAEILAEDYNCPELLDAPSLPQGEFFHVRRENRVRVVSRHKLF